MKKKLTLTILLTLAVAAGFGFYSTNQSSPVQISDFSPPEKQVLASTEIFMEPQEMTDNEVNKKNKPETSVKERTATITSGEIITLNENFPNKGEVNEEVKLNPHTPSKSLMMFAKQLGPLMEKAFKNESDANILVKELSVCANDESVANAARATCVKNTERLAEVHPKMEKTAVDLRADVSPEVQKILDTNDSFIKK